MTMGRAALIVLCCMKLDLVAHCGQVNRGSYSHILALADIPGGWTEAMAHYRAGGVTSWSTLDRIRLGLPFALHALDVDKRHRVRE